MQIGRGARGSPERVDGDLGSEEGGKFYCPHEKNLIKETDERIPVYQAFMINDELKDKEFDVNVMCNNIVVKKDTFSLKQNNNY